MSRGTAVDRQGPEVFPSRVVLKDLGRRAGEFAYDRLVAPRRDARPVERQLRNLAAIANELLGRPLRPANESGGQGDPVADPVAATSVTPRERAPTPAGKPPATRRAPVLVYFDGKDHRTLARVEDLLKSRGYTYQVLDVSADEAELSWATTAAKTHELPLVFVAGAPVGGWDALLKADVAGELAKLVSASA
jgi:glutaredoxin